MPDRSVSHHNLRAILALPGFRRLLAARLVSQVADGLFQAGLASSVFFNPQHDASAGEITKAFAVVLLPYSLLGPFVGVFLDRWNRRTSMAVANVARAALVVPAAAWVWMGRLDVVFLLAALLVVALNRFFLAGMSSALPHVVNQQRLVTANAFGTTFGTVVYTVSLGVGGFVIQLWGTAASHHYAVVSLTAVAIYLLSALLLAGWFSPTALGPEDAQRATGSVLREVWSITTGMVEGLRHVLHRPAAAAMLGVQAAHRLLFGLLTLETLLLYRNHYAHGSDEGIVGLLAVAGAGAAGALLAAVVTPPLTRRLGGPRWIVLLTAALAILVPSVGLPYVVVLTVVGAFLVALGAQATKIVTDTTLQVEVEDDYRGRVFSVNDTGYNIFYVGGLLIGASALPADGVSVLTVIGAGIGYALVAVGYGTLSRRIAARAPLPTTQ